MEILACTLLADGSSDQVLRPILRWLLDMHCPLPHHIEFAPMGTGKLEIRIAKALDEYPCNLLFVHRDSEREDPGDRQLEIDHAWACQDAQTTRIVAVIPVRMTEAWLLFDESAIRHAAGNPNGTVEIRLPKLSRVEQLPDPKGILFDVLRLASGQTPTRLRKFRPEQCRHRIADWTQDFSPLRQLPAFQRLEAQVQAVFQN